MAARSVPSNSRLRKLGPYEAEIIALYAQGYGCHVLAKRFGVLKCSLRGFLKRRGVQIRHVSVAPNPGSRKFTDQEYIEITDLYLDGMSTSKIANLYNIDVSHVLGVVRRSGETVRTISESKRLPIHNENAFGTRSPEACYWAGFWLADGTIGDTHGPIIQLKLQARDRLHIEKFRDFIGSGHLIHSQNAKTKSTGKLHPQFSISLMSETIVRDLATFGVVRYYGAKDQTMEPPGEAAFPPCALSYVASLWVLTHLMEKFFFMSQIPSAQKFVWCGSPNTSS